MTDAAEFEVLDACCLAGGRIPNEDAFGHSGRFAWVIDGATPLSAGGVRAHEWSRALSAALATLAADAADTATLMAAAVRQAASRLGWSEDPDLEPYELVSAAGILAMARTGGVDLLSWGDCEAATVGDDGLIQRLCDSRLPEIDARTLVALEKLRAGSLPEEEATRRWLEDYVRPARCLMNTDGGYPTLTPDGRGLPMAFRVSVDGARRVLLFSDGLAWGLDDFGLFTARELLDGVLPLSRALGFLRHAETDDADRRKAVRYKVSDDATGLLLAVRES